MPPEEAWRRVDGKEALLLDVVGTTSWERLSAVPAPAIRIPPEELRDRIDELPFEREIISFCT